MVIIRVHSIIGPILGLPPFQLIGFIKVGGP